MPFHRTSTNVIISVIVIALSTVLINSCNEPDDPLEELDCFEGYPENKFPFYGMYTVGELILWEDQYSTKIDGQYEISFTRDMTFTIEISYDCSTPSLPVGFCEENDGQKKIVINGEWDYNQNFTIVPDVINQKNKRGLRGEVLFSPDDIPEPFQGISECKYYIQCNSNNIRNHYLDFGLIITDDTSLGIVIQKNDWITH